MNSKASIVKVIIVVLLISFLGTYAFGQYTSLLLYIGLSFLCAGISLICIAALGLVAYDAPEILCFIRRTPKPGWIYKYVYSKTENPFDERMTTRINSYAVVVEVLKGYIKYRLTNQHMIVVKNDDCTCSLSDFHANRRRATNVKVVTKGDIEYISSI